MITAEDLRRVDAEWKAAQANDKTKAAERRRVIRQALAEGWTHARVAEALGVTRGRIGQF